MGDTIANLVIVSDLHVGCRVGLAHPDGHEMDDGATYWPTKLQQKMWCWWEEFWSTWVPEVTHGEPYAVCLNGDCLDGVHHNSVTQWTQNLTFQRRAAVKILRPVVEMCGGRYYHVRGTEAHAGKSGQDEEEIASQLNAIPNKDGQYARYELWIRVGRGLAHITHHIGTAGSMHYESTAPMRELTEAYVESGRWKEESPDWVVRSHRHRNVEVRVQTHKGFATVAVTAGWQLKMLALETPLPTPDGWTTMGEVKLGDRLFDENGQQCRVVAAHPINLNPESFEVKFSNGQSVKACADHLWLTTACVDKPGVAGHGGEKRPLTRVRTTREIYETLFFGKNNDRNHRLAMPLPLDIQDAVLPVDPYVLGCWLGDGDSDSARLSCSASDAGHYATQFNASGYVITKQSTGDGKCPRFRIAACSEDTGRPVSNNSPNNLQSILRVIGVIGNKHIPSVYLRASYGQRLALLQGLMDTDGHPDCAGRSCFFTTTLPALRDGFSELLATMGIKFSVTKQPSKCNGKIVGEHWFFRFFASPDVIPLFRMQRKISRIPMSFARKTAQKSRVVHIASVEPCAPVAMRCIAVDSPSSLYRFGKTMLYTHNTPFAYKIAGARQAQPQIGGTLLRCGDSDLFTRHKVWSLARPDIETCSTGECGDGKVKAKGKKRSRHYKR